MLGFIKNLQCVDNTQDETQDGEKDVDQEISTTSALEEDTERWEDDGKNDLEDIAAKKLVMLWKIYFLKLEGKCKLRLLRHFRE